MYNRGAFGLTAFNRALSVLITITSHLHGDGRLQTVASVEAASSAALNGGGRLSSRYIRDITNTSVTLEAIAELATDFLRDRSCSADLFGDGYLTVRLRQTHVSYVTVDTSIAPGDRVTLDANRNLAVKNGVAIGHIGDIPMLYPGESIIRYMDPETNRSIQVRITYQDRYL